MKKNLILGFVVVLAALTGTLAWANSSTAKTDVAAYESLLTTIYGTTEDRYRGEKLLHHRIQNVLQTCMEQKGLAYHPPAYAGSAAGVVSPGDLDIGTPLGESFGIADRHRAYAEGLSDNVGNNLQAKSPEELTAYGTASEQCMAQAVPLEEDYYPAAQPEVVNRLLAELQKIQSDPAAEPLRASYQDCLHQAGYTANTRLELYAFVAEQFPLAGQPWPELSATQQWQDAARAEQKAATTDKTCRANLYHWAVGVIRPVVDTLSTDPQVKAVQQGWLQIKTDFSAAGL